MKKINIKPLIISSLSALALGAVGVGTTFALFTDKAETSISVKAGVVEAKSDVKLISYENTGDLTNAAKEFTTETSYTTEIGTSFSIDANGNFNIQKMVPGDKVVLSVGFKNLSNVDTKYRLSVKNDGGDLVPALKVSMTGGNVLWKALDAASDAEIAAGGKSIETAVVTIEFVNHNQGILDKDDPEALDNKYMNATATYSLGYELVQGNAATVDEVGVLDGYEEVAAKPTNLHQGEAYQFNETVGGGVATFNGWSKDDGDVVLTVEKSEDANFEFSGADTTISYELTATNTDPDKDVTVSVFVGTGYASVIAKHNGQDIASTYNAETGYVTFVTRTFSPFQFVCFEEEITYVTTAAQLADALENDEDGKIYIGANFECADIMMVSKDTEIYGLGHEIKGKANRVFRVTAADLDVKMYNLKITSICTDTSDVRGISFDNESAGSSLLLDGCNVSASFYAINAIPGADNLNITIKNGTVVEGWAALNIYSSNSIINIENATLKGLNDKDYNSDGWNNFNTITIDCKGHPAGECGYNNTINIANSTIYASSSSGNKQRWLGLQNRAISNKVIVDQNSKCINEFGNHQIDNFLVTSLPNSIVVNGNELLRQADAYYTNGPANYNEGNITSTNPTGAMDCYFESPFINGWLADGEGVRLLSDIELSSNITLQMTSGSIYLIFNGHTITGGKIVLQGAASVISENGNMSSVFEGNVTVTDNQDGSYTYSLSE